MSPPQQPNVLLAIEEPEIYQHPNRQRHFARVLLALTAGTTAGVALKTQVIYTTHSPLFVGLDRFNEIRRLRKVSTVSGKPKATTVASTTVEEIAGILWTAGQEDSERGGSADMFTGEALRGRLHTLMTPWVNEGFFADVVVLVEGEGDRAAVLGCALACGNDFESMGISVIPCDGKSRMDRPAAIFRALNIPCYLLWDSDSSKKGSADGRAALTINRRLLQLVGSSAEDFPEIVADNYSCFGDKLETTLRAEFGAEEYASAFDAAQKLLGYPDKKAAAKSPLAFAHLVQNAAPRKEGPMTLRAVVDKIVQLKLSS